jgi:hypothetical protein
MNKTFDCIKMKNGIQEQIWIEAGETFEGLVKLVKSNSESSELMKRLIERKKENEIKSLELQSV